MQSLCTTREQEAQNHPESAKDDMGTDREEKQRITVGIAVGVVGLAFCLVARDMPQFLALTSLSRNPALQYGLAVARALVFAVAIGVVVYMKRRRETDMFTATRFFIVMLAGSASQCIGLCLLVLSGNALRSFAGTLLLGVGQSLLVTMWAIWLLRHTPHDLLRILAASLLVAGVLEMAFSPMNDAAVFGISLAVPFASCFFAWLLVVRNVYPDYRHYKRGGRISLNSRLVLYLAALFICSFTVRQLTDLWMPQSDRTTLFLFELCGGIGTAGAAGLAAATVAMGRRHRNAGMFLLLAIPFIVLAAYMSSFLEGPLAALYLTPLFIMRKFLLIAALLCSITYKSGRDRFLGFCLSMACVELGSFAQTAVMRIAGAAAFSAAATPIVIALSLVALCIIPLAVILPSSGQFAQEEPDMGIEEKRAELREQALDQIADEFKLTAREREVLGYLNTGRNADYIAKTLYIAHSTAKSHIAHIYQKTGMNSQQKVMDDVERRITHLNASE